MLKLWWCFPVLDKLAEWIIYHIKVRNLISFQDNLDLTIIRFSKFEVIKTRTPPFKYGRHGNLTIPSRFLHLLVACHDGL